MAPQWRGNSRWTGRRQKAKATAEPKLYQEDLPTYTSEEKLQCIPLYRHIVEYFANKLLL